MSFLKKLLAPFQAVAKHPLESFIQIETADDEQTLATRDGSLLTLVRIDGSRQIIGQEEYNYLIESSTIKIGAKFDREGHAIQIFFTRDPGRIRSALESQIKPSRVSASNIGLDVDDLLEERIRHLSRFLIYEEFYFVLWTRPSALTKNEMQQSMKEGKEKAQKWLNAGFAQYPFAAIERLRTRHKSFVSSVVSALNDLGISNQTMGVHDALKAVRGNLFPEAGHDNWSPCLPGDPIAPRAPQSYGDMSDVLWPAIRAQLMAGSARQLDDTTVRIGRNIWGGVDMTLAPMDPSPFPMLLNRLFEANVPFRISFLIEGGGAQAGQFRAFMASILSVTNSVNRQIKDSLEHLQAIARAEPVVKLRVSFATWAPANDKKLLDDRISVMMQSIESWGYCQVSNLIGDPLDAVMSSALGIACASTAPAAVAPMMEVMRLIPWQRPSSPFEQGSLILRTPDGKIWPYQTGTNLTTTWFDLIFAQPGAGKSVLMNSLNFATIIGPGMNKLPYVAVIDIGPSSSGLISLIKEALPPNRRHEAAYYRLQMSQEYAINPFDTQLGCRYPMIEERSYLVELMTLLCTPPGQDKAYDGIQQLAGLVIDEIYRWRNDEEANAEPRPYLPRVDDEVDEALKKYNIHLPTDPYWWDVVEKLFEQEAHYHANLAQRHAVPTLGDTITAARRPQIRSLLEETSIGSSAENVISAFERMITSAIREYPILSSVTKFEITDARVCSLDLMDVSPQGDSSADRQTAIMYMLARHALVRSWWMGKEALQFIPEKFRAYHEARLQDLAETPKRICYDEFHRTSSSPSVRNQIIRDVREGRKRSVQIVLASQLLDDFDDNMVDLATGVWVLGTAISDKAVDNAQERFGLTDTARNVIRYRLTGPRSSGAPALFVLGTTNGRYEQHLINTLGPIELWALSTSSEDVAIRTRLYSRLGASRARQVLAANFPGGSARSEIKRRVYMLSEQGDSEKAAAGAVIEEIVQELVDATLESDTPIDPEAAVEKSKDTSPKEIIREKLPPIEQPPATYPVTEDTPTEESDDTKDGDKQDG